MVNFAKWRKNEEEGRLCMFVSVIIISLDKQEGNNWKINLWILWATSIHASESMQCDGDCCVTSESWEGGMHCCDGWRRRQSDPLAKSSGTAAKRLDTRSQTIAASGCLGHKESNKLEHWRRHESGREEPYIHTAAHMCICVQIQSWNEWKMTQFDRRRLSGASGSISSLQTCTQWVLEHSKMYVGLL